MPRKKLKKEPKLIEQLRKGQDPKKHSVFKDRLFGYDVVVEVSRVPGILNSDEGFWRVNIRRPYDEIEDSFHFDAGFTIKAGSKKDAVREAKATILQLRDSR